MLIRNAHNEVLIKKEIVMSIMNKVKSSDNKKINNVIGTDRMKIDEVKNEKNISFFEKIRKYFSNILKSKAKD